MALHGTSVAFITEMKLRRLREMRDVLRVRYDEIEAEAVRAATPEEKLRALYDGLRSVEVAGHRLHPEVTNLEAVLLGASSAAWIERLERELAAGRLRTDVMYAYAAILGEWSTRGGRVVEDPDHEARVRAVIERAAPVIDRAFLDEALAALDPKPLRDACSAEDAAEEEGEDTSPFVGSVEAALERIANDPEKSAALRAEARQFVADGDLKKDLSDAIAMLFERIDDWRWDERGLPLRSVWTGDRHRVHLDVDLMNAVLVDVVTARWSEPISRGLRGRRSLRLARVRRLRELNAPAVILANEERLLAEASDGLLADPVLVAAGTEVADRAIAAVREEVVLELANAGLRASSYGGEYGTAMRSLVVLVSAEVALARALDRPLTLVKTDIRDFFPSVSHELVLRIAEHFGVPERWRAVFERYLGVRVEGAHSLAVGLPLGFDLSRLFGEMILGVVEAYVRRGLPSVRVARLVDDIVLFTPSHDDAVEAWRRLQAITRAMGLVLSDEKTGSVCVGGARGDGLPHGNFRLGALELAADGAWQVSEVAIAEATTLGRKKIGEAATVLDAVAVANTHLRRFVASLAPSARLGEGHVERVARSVTRFQASLFEGGLLGHLRRSVAALAPGESIAALPAAWLHWPLTAGGLGLVDGHVEIAPHARHPKIEAVPRGGAIPPDLETSANPFAALYDAHLQRLEPAEPESNPLADGLAADFIRRKDEMRGAAPAGEQKLAPYWRWVLSTHGPDILAAFGSYRFLLHQLLPLHLIQSRRFRRSAPAQAADDIPF